MENPLSSAFVCTFGISEDAARALANRFELGVAYVAAFRSATYFGAARSLASVAQSVKGQGHVLAGWRNELDLLALQRIGLGDYAREQAWSDGPGEWALAYHMLNNWERLESVFGSMFRSIDMDWRILGELFDYEMFGEPWGTDQLVDLSPSQVVEESVIRPCFGNRKRDEAVGCDIPGIRGEGIVVFRPPWIVLSVHQQQQQRQQGTTI